MIYSEILILKIKIQYIGMGLCTSKKEHLEIPVRRITYGYPIQLNYDHGSTEYATLANYSGKPLPKKRYPRRNYRSTNTRLSDPYKYEPFGVLTDAVIFGDW